MAELTVALVGCGGMGGVHLARWSQVSGVQIAAVCDIDAATATRAATEFGGSAHTDWREMLAGNRFSVVDICTPTGLHLPIAIEALDRGMNVFCEMPIARTADEARTMVERARANNVLLIPGLSHRFHPPVLFARELVDNDDLGRVVMFRSRLSDLLSAVENHWVADPEMAGRGVLNDVTVHQADLFRWLVGEVKSVSGSTAVFNPHLSVPDSAALVVEAENGALGALESSWSTIGGQNVLELYGTAGACFVDYDTGRVRFKTADMAVWETREVGGPDRFQREINHFADVVRGLQPPLVTAEDGVRALEIVAMAAS